MADQGVDVDRLNVVLNGILGRLDKIEEGIDDLDTVVFGQDQRLESIEDNIRLILRRN